MESRFIDLEMRMAFLERGLEKLDEVVQGQQDQIDKLLAENRRLKRALERALEGPGEEPDEVEDEPGPQFPGPQFR